MNWYRGNNARTDNSPPATPDGTTAPSQTTSYDTTDDPNADPDNPASDGNGSRHNYTTIGQVNLTYDNNRNVLADGTRQFRYNYKNQLRKVWRKSDGDSTTTGRVAEYREDAFARRVHAQSWWELGRHAYFDTRFELDVNLDLDGDGSYLELVDGGMQSTIFPPNAYAEQRSQWPSLIDRPTGDNEAHYFDFVLDVHQPAVGTVYHGYVAYEEYQLRIFTDRYELWNDASGTLIATVFQSTPGRRNIGLRAGNNSGVWVDGTQIIGGGIPIKVRPKAGFGARALSVAQGLPAITLFENLTYLRSYYRTVDDENGVPSSGQPRVTVQYFDQKRPVTVIEITPILPEENRWKDDQSGDGTHTQVNNASGSDTRIYLVTGRRTTGHVITSEADSYVATGDGTLVKTPATATIGVSITVKTDAVGQTQLYSRAPDGGSLPAAYPLDSPESMQPIGTYEYACVPVYHGTAGEPDDTTDVAPPTGGVAPGSNVPDPDRVTSSAPKESKASRYFNSDNTKCNCRDGNPSQSKIPETRVNPSTGNIQNDNGGDETDVHDDVEECIGPVWDGAASQGSDGNWYVHIDGVVYRIVDPSRIHSDGSFDIGPWDCESKSYGNIEEVVYEEYQPTYSGGQVSVLGYLAGVGAGLFWSFGDAITGLANSLGEFIKNPGGFVKDMFDGLGQLVNALKAGDVMGVLDKAMPGVAGFIRTHFLPGSERVSSYDKGKALAAMIVEIASSISGGPGSIIGKVVSHIGKMVAGTAGIAGAALKAAECAANYCFVEGTLVWVVKDDVDMDMALLAMRTGQNIEQFFDLVPIETLRPGMLVLSKSEHGFDTPLELRAVTFTTSRLVDELVELTIVDDRTSSVSRIRTTPGHPIWTWARDGELVDVACTIADEQEGLKYVTNINGSRKQAESGWTFATDIKPGQWTAGTTSPQGVVARVQSMDAPGTRVYNFGVEGTRTYFVSGTTVCGSAQPVWVHNTHRRTSKKPPNQHGSKGKPDHQEAVAKDNKRMVSEAGDGQEVLRERRVQGHDGCRRVPDNQVVEDGKTVKVVERERKPNSKYVKGKKSEYEKRGIEAEFKGLDED
ncbi:MAG: hypothetical protein KF754_15300 [Planctomycetes bacterium]|nr:hypothetical protein [Planctomycetota bacterium]